MDKLIHGPQKESDAPPPVEIDLNHTNPFADLYYLFRSPKSFFVTLSRTRASTLVFIKALGGLLFFSWLREFLKGPTWIENFAHYNTSFFNDPALQMLLRDVDVEQLKAQIFAFALAVGQLKMILFPIWSLLDVLGIAASVMLFLPLLGVPRERLNFFFFFLAFMYVKWFAVLALIPVVGVALSAIWIAVLTIKVTQWVHGISAFRSFCAAYLMHILSFVVLPLFSLLLGGLLFLLFLRGG